jgi:hypothetical protein
MPDTDTVININKYVTLSVDIPFELKDKLKFRAYKENKSIKELVKESLQQYFVDYKE